MGMSFTSCSSDDDGPGSGSIKENLEGEWFLINLKWECTEDGNETITWDYDDQTAEGVCSDGCTDNDPEKIYIECVGENTYEMTRYYYSSYSSRWIYEDTWTYELDGNILAEGTFEESGNEFYCKEYIKAISENQLVVVSEESYKEDGRTHKDVGTYTYRRNN